MTGLHRVLAPLLLCMLADGAIAQHRTGDPAVLADIDTLQAAAQSGTAAAQYALGLRYHDGTGVLQDYAQAAEWFARAAEQGHPAAQNHLARYLFEGLGGPRQPDAALALFAQAARSGDPQFLFDHALAIEADRPTEAAAIYAQAIAAGHAEASVNLGVLFQDGRGVEQDFARARELYEGPARTGHPRALNNLGLLYVRGNGVPQDYARAAEYFTAAADLGLSTAMTNLGVLYENGFGVPLDEARATELYRQGGRPDGQPAPDRFALIYDDRLAPPPDDPEALQRLTVAAQAGDPVALFQLGWLMSQASDAPFEAHGRAAQLFRAAAERGHGPSMINLGVLYFRGLGVPQDYVLGHMWLLMGAEAGVARARDISALSVGKLTAGQVNEAQSLAKARRANPGLRQP